MKKLIVLSLIYATTSLYGNDFYHKSTLHAFLPKVNSIQLRGGIEKVNDTLDVLNIKESEFSSNSSNFDSLGDMEGLDFNLGYTFSEQWYINMQVNYKQMNYADTTLNNNKIDIYGRYQLYKSEHSAFAIDIGYNKNMAKDTYIYDIPTINNTLAEVVPNRQVDITSTSTGNRLVYRGDDGSIKTAALNNKPYVAIIDTEDESFYTRAIYSFKQEDYLLDIYSGYSETKIKNQTDSSILSENNPDLKKELSDIGLIDTRTDAMLFGGIGLGYQYNKWYTEFNYQYNHILRIQGLNTTRMNHIFDLNLFYTLNQNFSVYFGGKLMLNQFNGEIPYLYTQYTDTSFDHKYGFLNAGIIYNF